MHDLKSLRGKCTRINRDQDERHIRFDVSRVDGDAFEVRMRSDANEALYRGSGDACWRWIEGNGTGWLLARNRAARGVMTEGMSKPAVLAPGDKTAGALRDSGRRLYAACTPPWSPPTRPATATPSPARATCSPAASTMSPISSTPS